MSCLRTPERRSERMRVMRVRFSFSEFQADIVQKLPDSVNRKIAEPLNLRKEGASKKQSDKRSKSGLQNSANPIFVKMQQVRLLYSKERSHI